VVWLLHKRKLNNSYVWRNKDRRDATSTPPESTWRDRSSPPRSQCWYHRGVVVFVSAPRWASPVTSVRFRSCASRILTVLIMTWLIQMCDMTHSDVWHDSLRCLKWLIQMCEMSHSNGWHDSVRCVIWLIQMCDMTYSDMWHESFICVTRTGEGVSRAARTTRTNESCQTYEWVMSHIVVSHVTHMNYSICAYGGVMSHINEWCHAYEWVMSYIWRS